MESPLARASERRANRKSCKKVIDTLLHVFDLAFNNEPIITLRRLATGAEMNEWVGRGALGTFVSDRASLDTEFEARLRDSSGLAFGVAYGVLRNREDAEEVAQDAFARAFRRFDQLRDRDAFRSWLTRMTWRLAIDRWRSDRRRAAREQVVAVDREAVNTEQVVLDYERSQAVWQAIDRLPHKLRMVLVLSAIEGHGTREVAHLLNIPEGTVKSRMFLARKTLAEQLQWMKS